MILMLLLTAPDTLGGEKRRAVAAFDTISKHWVAIDRYGAGTADGAIKRIIERERFAWPTIMVGPEVMVPTRQLHEISDSLKARRAQRGARQERRA